MQPNSQIWNDSFVQASYIYNQSEYYINLKAKKATIYDPRADPEPE